MRIFGQADLNLQLQQLPAIALRTRSSAKSPTRDAIPDAIVRDAPGHEFGTWLYRVSFTAEEPRVSLRVGKSLPSQLTTGLSTRRPACQCFLV